MQYDWYDDRKIHGLDRWLTTPPDEDEDEEDIGDDEDFEDIDIVREDE